jgi:hypothetical protein
LRVPTRQTANRDLSYTDDGVEGDVVDAWAVADAASAGGEPTPGVAVLVTDGVGGLEAVCAGVVGAGGGIAAFGGAAGLGGAGFSGLIPPSQDGPEYISAVKPLVFHFSSKSAAALLGVSPTPVTSFQGYTFGPIWHPDSVRRKYNAIGLPR